MSLSLDLLTVDHSKKRSVSFAEPEADTKSIELSDETEALVRKEWRSRKISRPRMTSVFYMVNSKFAGGIITRANYMTRCFQTAWEMNRADIPALKILLWNGESSQQTVWVAVLGLVCQWIVPFLPLLFLINAITAARSFQIIVWGILVLEIIMLIWHAIVLYVLLKNERNWRQAWFSFEVPSGTIGLVDSGESHELTLFHFSANIRFIKTSFSTISKLHTISKHEQVILEQNMRFRQLEIAEVILYTECFLDCYSKWPRYMTIGLFSATLLSVGFVIYFLGCHYR
ncbi:uncharacterized protein LOC130621132 [Hydractinia symbiolongicarpus]|uniref:uncharacterized protein LOC130621132 n=1 Tax=Hydractinia symbiolongicarpus TaxID=13093 RepID=UPI00254F4AB6|nr:uncharacterized protein LOC130621132 [Hydractinia symbiolongicarpus]